MPKRDFLTLTDLTRDEAREVLAGLETAGDTASAP